METDIIIEGKWDYGYWDDEEYLFVNKIWCESCGHEFDITEYSEGMIDEMNYCPFCGNEIRRVVYE